MKLNKFYQNTSIRKNQPGLMALCRCNNNEQCGLCCRNIRQVWIGFKDCGKGIIIIMMVLLVYTCYSTLTVEHNSKPNM